MEIALRVLIYITQWEYNTWSFHGACICTGVPSGFQPPEDTDCIRQKVSVSIFRVYVMTITSACCFTYTHSEPRLLVQVLVGERTVAESGSQSTYSPCCLTWGMRDAVFHRPLPLFLIGPAYLVYFGGWELY